LKNNILENRVYKNKKYDLVETLNNINHDNPDAILINEAGKLDVLRYVYKFMNELAYGAVDTATFGVGGVLMLPFRLAKNAVELSFTNRKAKILIEKYENNQPNDSGLKELENCRYALAEDIIDVLNAVIAVVPIPAIDTLIQLILATKTGTEKIAEMASERYMSLYKSLNPELTGYLDIGSKVFGGPVIWKGMTNLIKISKIIPSEPLIDTLKKDKTINFLNEKDEDEVDEGNEKDIEEINTIGSLGISGRIGPLGDEDRGSIYDKKRKAVNEQRERIALLQAYHQKTTNKLK
jgi:hypothetical protein